MRAGKRLAKVAEVLTAREREGRRRVVVYLPRKDDDSGPLGVVSQRGEVLTVRYDAKHPDPPLPTGW